VGLRICKILKFLWIHCAFSFLSYGWRGFVRIVNIQIRLLSKEKIWA
jgi:hypothetical protein